MAEATVLIWSGTMHHCIPPSSLPQFSLGRTALGVIHLHCIDFIYLSLTWFLAKDMFSYMIKTSEAILPSEYW